MTEQDPIESVKGEILVHQDGTADWNLEYLSVDGTFYSGAFKFRCVMDPLQIIAADRDQRRLLGDHQGFAEDVAYNLAFMLSQLRQRVIDSPPFWREGQEELPGGRVKEYQVIKNVFNAAVAAQSKFRDELQAQSARKAERIRQTLAQRAKDEAEEVKRDPRDPDDSAR